MFVDANGSKKACLSEVGCVVGLFILTKKGRNSSSCVHKNFQKDAFQHFASEMCPVKGNSYEVCGSLEKAPRIFHVLVISICGTFIVRFR